MLYDDLLLFDPCESSAHWKKLQALLFGQEKNFRPWLFPSFLTVSSTAGAPQLHVWLLPEETSDEDLLVCEWYPLEALCEDVLPPLFRFWFLPRKPGWFWDCLWELLELLWRWELLALLLVFEGTEGGGIEVDDLNLRKCMLVMRNKLHGKL